MEWLCLVIKVVDDGIDDDDDEIVFELNEDDDEISGGEFESLYSLLPPSPFPLFGCDNGPILFRKIREIEETEGTLNLSHILSNNNFSRISHANMPGSFTL